MRVGGGLGDCVSIFIGARTGQFSHIINSQGDSCKQVMNFLPPML